MFKKKQAKVVEPEPEPKAEPRQATMPALIHKNAAKVVEAVLLDNGLIRSVVISGKPLEEVGVEFELED